MNAPQHWETCEDCVKGYILEFVRLLERHLRDNLKGVYLHGSLAMGSFYPPKSDIDIIAVACRPLPPGQAARLNAAIAGYAESGQVAGGIEFSLIRAEVAQTVPSKPTCILHYSEAWHDRILGGGVDYTDELLDTDLCAHLTVLKRRGVCLAGESIEDTFGEGSWEDFVSAVTEDLEWILTGDHLCESPYYGILNSCRVLQVLTGRERRCLSKDEGGQWGLAHLPAVYHPLIQKALDVYHAAGDTDRKTGGAVWNRAELRSFREYLKAEAERHKGRAET